MDKKTMSIFEISKHVDKIIVNLNDFQRIRKFLLNYDLGTDVYDKRMFFPLSTFVLDMSVKKNARFLFLVELNNFNPAIGKCTMDMCSFEWKRLFGGFDIKAYGTTQEECQTLHSMVLGVIAYICLKGRETKIKVVESNKNQIEKHNKSEKSYEYKDRECFLLNDIVKYVSEHPTRKSLTYRCECWGVRGHIRHYKNGKVCFIKPYKKGAKKDVLEPKSRTYLLGEQEDKNDRRE